MPVFTVVTLKESPLHQFLRTSCLRTKVVSAPFNKKRQIYIHIDLAGTQLEEAAASSRERFMQQHFLWVKKAILDSINKISNFPKYCHCGSVPENFNRFGQGLGLWYNSWPNIAYSFIYIVITSWKTTSDFPIFVVSFCLALVCCV